MSTSLTLIDKDPTELGFPPTLPLELAARTGSPAEICDTYGISAERFEELKGNPVFVRACEEALKVVGEDGGGFKLKARTIAELYLKKMWDLTEETDFSVVPANVRADIMKFTIRAAGLDQSIEQKASAQGKGIIASAIQINFNF